MGKQIKKISNIRTQSLIGIVCYLVYILPYRIDGQGSNGESKVTPPYGGTDTRREWPCFYDTQACV